MNSSQPIAQPPSPVKNFLSFLLRIGISVLLLWFIFSRIDTEKTLQALRSADLIFLAVAGFVFMAINGFILLRWIVFMRGLKIDASAFTASRYFFLGLFGNLFLPSAIGGDLLKIIGLCRKSDQKPRIIASVLLDRLSGFAAIAIVAIFSFFLGYKFIEEKSLLMPILVLTAGSFAIALVLFNEKIYRFFCHVFHWFPRLKEQVMKVHYDIKLLGDRPACGYGGIVISCACQVLLAVTFYLVARALHQDIGLLYFLIYVPMICVASAVPSIGGLGVREAGAVYLFGKIGVDPGIAVSISLLNFFFMVVVGLWGGLYFQVTARFDR